MHQRFSRSLGSICPLRPVLPLTMCVALVGCGEEGSSFEHWSTAGKGPPVALLTSIDAVTCFSPQLPQTYTSQGILADHLRSAARQMNEYQLAYALQSARMVARPILEAPTALAWKSIRDNGRDLVQFEGYTVARGVGWGHIAMAAFTVGTGEMGQTTSGLAAGGNQPASNFSGGGTLSVPSLSVGFNADIRYSPNKSIYDFGDRRVTISRNYIEYVRSEGRTAIGCDPRSKISFAIGADVVDGRIQHDVVTCWRPDQVPPEPDDSREYAEYVAAMQLMCLQAVGSAMSL